MGLFRRKKEIEMKVTKKVKFTVADGRRPTRQGASKVFNLLAPVGMIIPAGTQVRVDLGVSCDHPLHVFQASNMVKRGVLLVDGIWAAQDADVPLILPLENRSNEDAMIEEGDTLARAAVFDNSDIEVE